MNEAMGLPSAGIRDVDPENDRLSVNECYACRGPHVNLEARQFSRPCDPWTHWYICPTTGDPCSVTVKSRNGVDVELNQRIIEDIVLAQQLGGGYLVLVVTPEEGRVILRRHAVDFPHRLFADVPALVHKNLSEEIGPPRPEQEMPSAGALPPINQDPFRNAPSG